MIQSGFKIRWKRCGWDLKIGLLKKLGGYSQEDITEICKNYELDLDTAQLDYDQLKKEFDEYKSNCVEDTHYVTKYEIKYETVNPYKVSVERCVSDFEKEIAPNVEAELVRDILNSEQVRSAINIQSNYDIANMRTTYRATIILGKVVK